MNLYHGTQHRIYGAICSICLGTGSVLRKIRCSIVGHSGSKRLGRGQRTATRKIMTLLLVGLLSLGQRLLLYKVVIASYMLFTCDRFLKA